MPVIGLALLVSDPTEMSFSAKRHNLLHTLMKRCIMRRY